MGKITSSTPGVGGGAVIVRSYEFIPFVQYDKASDGGLISSVSGASVRLSEHLDKDKIQQPGIAITMHTGGNKDHNVRLRFKVSKGNSQTTDTDGVITVKDPNDIVATVNKKAVKEVEIDYEVDKFLYLEISPGKIKKDSELKFIANDNDASWDWKGDITDVLCGYVKIKHCICNSWNTVEPVIPKSDFVGWVNANSNCRDLAEKQVAKKSGYAASNRDDAQIIVTYLEQVADSRETKGMPKGVQKQGFIDGVKYLTGALNEGIPVLVGVDGGSAGGPNFDKSTDHYIVIVGMGIDDEGCYFRFYDNRTELRTIGTSAANKLYCRCSDFKIEGRISTDFGITFIPYIVTHIRKTKKK